MVAGAGTGLSPRKALPPLVIGSSVFLQLHLFLGYFLGSAARSALRSATGPTLAVAGALLLGAAAFWFVRRGRRAGTAGVMEAACPACIVLALASEHPKGLKDLAILEAARAPTV